MIMTNIRKFPQIKFLVINGLILAAFFTMFIGVVLGSIHLAGLEKTNNLQEMTSNPDHICSSMGCMLDAHRNSYETPEEAVFYLHQITDAEHPQADDHGQLIAKLEARSRVIDSNAKYSRN